jgi:hypothetical protein
MYNYPQRYAEQSIQRLVNRIARMAGVEYRIEVLPSDDLHACSTSFKEETGQHKRPVINYNPVFIEQLETVNRWAAVAAFAHEVAFHYNNDLYGKYIANYSDNDPSYKARLHEINADKFTGWVLWHEGAKLKDAMELYKLPKFSDPYTSDPAKNDRKTTMRAGWVRAYGKKAKNPGKPKSKKDGSQGSDNKEDKPSDQN